MTKTQIMSKNVKNELETQIAGIIQYYYPTEKKPARLWEIVCDDLDIVINYLTNDSDDHYKKYGDYTPFLVIDKVKVTQIK